MKKSTLVCFGAAAVFTGGFFYLNKQNESGAENHRPTTSQKINAVSESRPTKTATSALPAMALSSDPQAPLANPVTNHLKKTSSDSGNANGLASQGAWQESPTPDSGASSQKSVEIAQLLQNADLSDPATRAEVVAQMTRTEEARMDEVLEKAAQLGIPVRIDGPNGKVSILYAFRGDEPLYRSTNNKSAAISTAANLAQMTPYGLDGSGIKIGVWDGGSIRSSHRELAGRVGIKNASAAPDDHATHVAGTIGATGVASNAKGMAPKISLESYDWDNDYAEMTAAGGATAGDLSAMNISNHSYGYNAATTDMGRYETEARTVDALVWALPFYLPFWSAGNEQDSLTALGGYQSITFNSVAKNLLAVGAVNDAVVAEVRSPSAAAMTTFSSWGPCDDGRIKPDVVANGAGVYSSTAASDSSYDTYSGTSMATPNAAGSAALLQQLYATNFSQRLRACMLKALLIHTADDLGTAGPDYKFGWGLINTKAAADLILAQKSNPASPKLLENTLTPTVKSFSATFAWDGKSPIRATLCWTDPAGIAQSAADSRTPNLVHDLDLKITGPDGSTTYLPFVMPFVGTWTAASMAAAATTGKNKSDNVEQVLIAAPNRAGSYTVTVSMDGQLTTASQTCSVVVTGMSGLASLNPTPTPSPNPYPSPSPAPDNPVPTVAISSPLNGVVITQESQINISATVSDLTSTGSAGDITKVEFFVGSTLLGVDTSAPYAVTWTPSAGNFTLQARATDSQGAIGTSTPVAVLVTTPTREPVVTGFSPSSGPVGTTVVVSGSDFSGATGVQFNGQPATIWSVLSSSQISVVVPSGATSGPIKVLTSNASGSSATSFTVTAPSPGSVVISQIYASGGRWWSDYSHDYVELYNSGLTPVSLAGWSLQFSGGTRPKWMVLPLKGTIPAKGFYLVALAGGGYSYDLPAADARGSINLAVKQGKVALMRTTKSLTVTTPVGTDSLADFVGYGFAGAWEGEHPAISPERWFAIFRMDGSDTNENYTDFDWDYPYPRNTKSPAVFGIKIRK